MALNDIIVPRENADGKLDEVVIRAATATPSSLATAAAGTSANYARQDHVHSAEVSDSAFRVIGSTDATKKVAVEVDTNVPTGTTVTLTSPASSGTLSLVGHTHAASDITSGSFGSISHDGKLGSTSGLPVVTTTAGAVTTLALGTANQVLRVNSGATGVEFADPAASGVTGAASSASDVLGVSGSNITGVDAGAADRLVMWDDSASKLTYASVSGMAFDGTTLRAARVDTYTANDTWTKPTGAKQIHYLLIGGGGGGGAGRRSASGTAAFGGGGGAGGGMLAGWADPAFFGDTVSVTVASGGAGGANSADSTNGSGGSAGGQTSFGSTLRANGGNAGGGGTSTTGGANGGGGIAVNLFYGTSGNAGAGGTGTSSGNVTGISNPLFSPAGGNGASGVDTGTTRGNGGNGAGIGQTNNGVTNGGNWNGNPTVNGGTSHSNFAGTGGAGPQAVPTTIEGRAGGNGGLYGGGGGGGSGARDGAGGSTAGGNGGAGIAVITTYF